MIEWKYLNSEKTAALEYTTNRSCTKDGYGWNEFQEYLAGGSAVDPWRTPEEILEMSLKDKLNSLETEHNTRVDIATGTTSSRKKSKIIARMVKLTRKESQGRASQKEVDELNLMEGLDDYLDELDSTHDVVELYLEDSGRTLEEIENYNVQVDPNWPVYGG